MANIKDSLGKLLEVDGAMCAAVVDSNSGMMLGSAGTGVDLEVAAAGNTEVVRAKLKTMKSLGLADKIAVASIEDFVAQNLDELAVFSLAETKKRLVHLLTVYNERVTAVEPDPALLIAIPENLSS